MEFIGVLIYDTVFQSLKLVSQLHMTCLVWFGLMLWLPPDHSLVTNLNLPLFSKCVGAPFLQTSLKTDRNLGT